MSETTAWRITSEKYAETAFSEEGAKEYGGRFNSPGTPGVYTSEYISLATLELLAKAGERQRRSGRIVLPVTFGEEHLIVQDEEDLPDGWDEEPYGPASQQIGDEWVQSGKSLVLQIPSVVVPTEHNYLINPEHPKFEKLGIGESVP